MMQMSGQMSQNEKVRILFGIRARRLQCHSVTNSIPAAPKTPHQKISSTRSELIASLICDSGYAGSFDRHSRTTLSALMIAEAFGSLAATRA